ERDLVEIQFLELDIEHQFGNRLAAFDIVVAVHQYFRFNNRNNLSRLAERGVTGQRMRIGADAGIGRNAGADVDHRPPFGEARALLVVFGQPVGQSVEPDRDDLARAHRQRLGAFVDLDAGNGAGLLDEVDQRRAVFGFLPDGLVIQDDAGNVLHAFGRAEQHFTIVAPRVLGRFHADGVEALLDG